MNPGALSGGAQRAAIAGLVVCVAVAGCGGDESTSELPTPVVAVYDDAASTALTPFPSDRYTVTDPTARTGLRVDIGAHNTADSLLLAASSVVTQLDEMDGFSTTGGVIVSFTGPIDVSAWVSDPTDEAVSVRDALDYRGPESPMLLLDVDPKSPRFGEAVGLVPRYWAQAADEYYLEDEFTIVAQPAVPLEAGTRYLFVVTRALQSASGVPLVASPRTRELVGGAEAGDYAARVDEALEVLREREGVRRDDVVLATVFTTASVHDGVFRMAELARVSPPPELVEPWTVETPRQADGRVRFRAKFATPEYRREPPDGKWELEGGTPVRQRTVGLEVFLAISDADSTEPRPVVIYQHGLGGDKDGSWGTAERLAPLDSAVFAIDSPEHGSRGDSEVTAVFRFFGIDERTQAFDVGRARDNFRQMASDQLELVRLIGSLGDLDLLPVDAPDGIPDLDVSRILYLGHSFGSVQGPTVFALAPEISQAVWNVGGDGMMTLLRDSQLFSILVNALRPPGVSDGALARFFAIAQAIVDPGDPLNFARFGALEAPPGVPGWRPRDMLLQEVIADSIVPNSTSEATARAAGLLNMDPVAPVSGLPGAVGPLTANADGATAVLSQFDRMNGDELAVHGSLIFADEAKRQYLEFFRSGLLTGRATAEPAYP